MSALRAAVVKPLTAQGGRLHQETSMRHPDDAAANTDALRIGGRFLSGYTFPDRARIWIMTEADMSSTTLLLPEKY